MVLTCLSGGLEMLFSNQRKHQISLPAKGDNGQAANVAFLVRYLCQYLMKDRREELFVMDGTVFVDTIILEYDSQETNWPQAAWYPRLDQRCRLGTRR